MKRPRLWSALLLSIVLGVASLMLALPDAVAGDVTRVATRFGIAGAAAVVATVVSWWAMAALRLMMLARAVEEQLGFLKAVQTHIVGVFGAVVTPAGGGNSVGIGYLLIRFGLKSENAVAIAVMCLVGDLTFFAWAVPVAGLGLHLVGVRLPVPQLGWLIGGLSLLAAAASYVLVFRLELAVTGLRALLSLRLFGWLQLRAGSFLDRLELASRRFAQRPWSWHLGFHTLSALARVVYFSVLLAILFGLGGNVPVVVTLAAQVIVHAFAFAIPTPGASGYQEASLSLILRGQFTTSTLSAAVILWRLAQHYLYFLVAPLFGGLAYLRGGAAGPKGGNAHESPLEPGVGGSTPR